jgi:Tfp pilus assembly PilM family ATPase
LVENGAVKIIHNTEKNISRATGQLQNESVVQALQKVINLYRNKFGIEDFSQKPICILTGGSVLALNLAGAIQRQFGGEVYIGDPFSRTNYPEILDATLKEIGPPLSVAAGLAMR